MNTLKFNVVLGLTFFEGPRSIHLTPEGFVLEEVSGGDEFSENQIPDVIKWVRTTFSGKIEYMEIYTTQWA